MIEFFSNGNGWITLGVALFIAEMVVGTGYVLISFGIGSVAAGLLSKFQLLPTVFSGVIDEALVMGILSLIALVVLKRVFNKDQSKDINRY